MAKVTVYVDLSDSEESKIIELKSACQEIINTIDTIDTKDNVGSDLLTKLNTISTKVRSMNPLLGQLNNIKSSVTDGILRGK